VAWTDPRAIFFAPHPDDETLSMGVAIVQHVLAGRDVHVVAVTQGEAATARHVINGTRPPTSWWGVPHNPAQEGFEPLDVAAFSAARVHELRAACSAMGVQPDRVHVYDLPDGVVHAEDVKALIRTDFAWPGASFKTLSYRWSSHPDHTACGVALHELQLEDPGTWGDARWYVYRPQWPVADPDPSTTYVVPTDAMSRQRVVNACRAYSGWSPALGVFAVGYHSVARAFADLQSDVRAMQQKS
jgi:LmbE family N-acetylglucosaminyl deacetylase